MLIEKTTDPKGLSVLKDMVYEMNCQMERIVSLHTKVCNIDTPLDQLVPTAQDIEVSQTKYNTVSYYAHFLARELGYVIKTDNKGWYDLCEKEEK